MNCRHCHHLLTHQFVDLGSAPPSNAYLTEESLKAPEVWLPLRVLVCDQCWLVQTDDFIAADQLFASEYAYFSSFSTSWLAHCERYVATAMERYGINNQSHVVELAANDGYLLQYFARAGVPCTGVEPTASTAAAAREKGIRVIESFFSAALADEMCGQSLQADLLIANNVLAHVPDINDFVLGCRKLLKPNGVATFEFPHLLELVKSVQFDTIYHEHFSYLSLHAVSRVFSRAGMTVFDVEQLGTHGGSLRVHARHSGSQAQLVQESVAHVLALEDAQGLTNTATFLSFQAKAERVKDDLLRFLLEAREECKSVAAYGAAAKGNTLLNFAGVRPDLIEFVVDRSPHKQGRYLPGSRIPIVAEERLRAAKPDYVVVLPWNLLDEIKSQLSYIREWGGQFVVAVPRIAVSPPATS